MIPTAVRSRLSLIFAFLFFFILQLNAQDHGSDPTVSDSISSKYNTTLQHTTLVVSNFAESKKFYTEVLGFKDLNADWLPQNQMFISLGKDLELHVGEVEGVEIRPSSFNHFAISTNDLDGYLEYLKSVGIDYFSLGGAEKYFVQKRPDGVRQTFIQDPDGYWIEINDFQIANQDTPELERKKIKALLEDYKKSINESDTTLARTFWLTDSRVSFIHPRGHEKGWDAIKKDIYEMFGSNFSKRDLKSYDETITLYDDMAILEFYWVFDATFAGENPTPLQTKGRETQVLKKIDGQWRIVHIHYSGMPMTGEREGF